MKIWIDGDACHKTIKDILFRAAIKRQVLVIMVSNYPAIVPPSAFIKRIQVEAGFDSADNYIITHVQSQDLVITADIILADLVVKKQALALNPRGILYSANNIKQVLAMRHLNESLRETGLIRGGMKTFSSKEIQNFSKHLDRILTQNFLNN